MKNMFHPPAGIPTKDANTPTITQPINTNKGTGKVVLVHNILG